MYIKLSKKYRLNLKKLAWFMSGVAVVISYYYGFYIWLNAILSV